MSPGQRQLIGHLPHSASAAAAAAAAAAATAACLPSPFLFFVCLVNSILLSLLLCVLVSREREKTRGERACSRLTHFPFVVDQLGLKSRSHPSERFGHWPVPAGCSCLASLSLSLSFSLSLSVLCLIPRVQGATREKEGEREGADNGLDCQLSDQRPEERSVCLACPPHKAARIKRDKTCHSLMNFYSPCSLFALMCLMPA